MLHSVRYEPEAKADLQELTRWIAGQAGPLFARAYVDLIRARCADLKQFPRRGSLKRERPEIRSIPFRRSATIVYYIVDEEVRIARILYSGRDIDRTIAALF